MESVKLPSGEPSLRLLDWALVNTELGAMIEPRALNRVNELGNKILDQKRTDLDFSKFSILDEGVFFSLTLCGGQQLPFNLT